jgi:hypothetical protein
MAFFGPPAWLIFVIGLKRHFHGAKIGIGLGLGGQQKIGRFPGRANKFWFIVEEMHANISLLWLAGCG